MMNFYWFHFHRLSVSSLRQKIFTHFVGVFTRVFLTFGRISNSSHTYLIADSLSGIPSNRWIVALLLLSHSLWVRLFVDYVKYCVFYSFVCLFVSKHIPNQIQCLQMSTNLRIKSMLALFSMIFKTKSKCLSKWISIPSVCLQLTKWLQLCMVNLSWSLLTLLEY